MARRHGLQKQAAFNLGVAEAVNEKKHARAEKEDPRAYLFQRRPLTPPRYLKQQQLQGYLTKQVWTMDKDFHISVLLYDETLYTVSQLWERINS